MNRFSELQKSTVNFFVLFVCLANASLVGFCKNMAWLKNHKLLTIARWKFSHDRFFQKILSRNLLVSNKQSKFVMP